VFPKGYSKRQVQNLFLRIEKVNLGLKFCISSLTFKSEGINILTKILELYMQKLKIGNNTPSNHPSVTLFTSFSHSLFHFDYASTVIFTAHLANFSQIDDTG